MEYYALEYEKDRCSDLESACCELVWDYFADYINTSLTDCINYTKLITEILEIKCHETKDSYLFLSEKEFEEIRL